MSVKKQKQPKLCR